jgi:hypothetical protein
MDTLQCYEHREALWQVYLPGTVVAARGGVLFSYPYRIVFACTCSSKCIVFSISVSERRMISSSTEI